MCNLKKYRGFALLEIMAASIILCGLVYMFIAFTQNYQRQQDNQNKAKLISIALNTAVEKITENNGVCPLTSLPRSLLTECVTYASGFSTSLRNSGLGNIYVDAQTIPTSSSFTLKFEILGSYTNATATLIAQQVFSNLSVSVIGQLDPTGANKPYWYDLTGTDTLNIYFQVKPGS